MAEKETTIGPKEGLHARPAAQFVKTAKGFESEISIHKGDRKANAKSSLNIMTLGAKHGDRVVIHAQGKDAEAAVEALVAQISADEH